jgi:hypothetical protein
MATADQAKGVDKGVGGVEGRLLLRQVQAARLLSSRPAARRARGQRKSAKGRRAGAWETFGRPGQDPQLGLQLFPPLDPANPGIIVKVGGPLNRSWEAWGPPRWEKILTLCLGRKAVAANVEAGGEAVGQ